MIIVKHIEYLATDRDIHELMTLDLSRHRYFDDPLAAIYSKVKTEIVKGRRFCNPRTGEVIIGLSEQVSEVLGVSFQTLDMLERELSSVNNVLVSEKAKNRLLRNIINNISKAKLLKFILLITDCVQYEHLLKLTKENYY